MSRRGYVSILINRLTPAYGVYCILPPTSLLLKIANPSLHNKLCIFNVYNEVVTDILSDLEEAIGEIDSDHELIVLGDFNLHHPLWSIMHCHANRGIPAAQLLLIIIKDSNLQPLTVLGTPTHRWKDGEITIDLTFASVNVASRKIYCKVDPSLDCDSEHLLIAITIDWSWQLTTPPKKQMWTKTNLPLL